MVKKQKTTKGQFFLKLFKSTFKAISISVFVALVISFWVFVGSCSLEEDKISRADALPKKAEDLRLVHNDNKLRSVIDRDRQLANDDLKKEIRQIIR